MTEGNENALIIFSRLPIGRETKTRLSPLLNDTQREELHLAMWNDVFSEVFRLKRIDVFLYWTGSGDVKDYLKFIPSSFRLMEQNGVNLGERMKNAANDIMNFGYRRAVIIGSDIPSIRAENITRAFNALNASDAVIGPSKDGGYWLIGMNRFIPEIFDVTSWGSASVLNSTIENLKTSGLTYEFADTLNDMDTPDDVTEYMKLNCNESSSTWKYLTQTASK